MSEAERLNIHLSARDKDLAQAIDRSIKRIERMERTAKGSLSRTSKSFDRLGQSAKASATGLARVTNISGAGRFVMQNTAAQLGDIAVQLEMGTSASRVMSQQLPQLLGGFGALGGALGVVAPLMGVVAAVGIPLAAMLMSMGGDADDAGEKVKTFADKLGEAEAALGRAEAAIAMASTGGLENLEKKYGDVTDKVRELSTALAEIEVRAAKAQIGLVLDDAFGPAYRAEMERVTGAVGSALAEAGTEGGRAAAQAMRDEITRLQTDISMFTNTNQPVPTALTDQLREMREQLAALEGDFANLGALASEALASPQTLQRLAELQGLIEGARDAGDFSMMADHLSEMRTLLAAMSGELDQGVLDAMVQAEDQARQMAARLGEAEEAAAGTADAAALIAAGIAPAVAEAMALAEVLEISLDTARLLRNLGPQGILPEPPKGGRGADPRTMGGSTFDWQTRDASQFLDNWKPAKSTRAGGRSKAAKKSPETKAYEGALKSLADKTDILGRRTEGYREEMERLSAAHKDGTISSAEFTSGLEGIKEAFEANARAAETLQSQAGDAFASFVTGAQSAREALGGLLASWASMAAKSAFSGLFSDGGGGGFFSALGELIGFDGGGHTGGGMRSGGLDGKGGFLAMMHPRESVIDHTRPTASPGASGGGSVQISVSVSGARGNSEIESMVENGVRQGLQEYDRNVLPRSVRTIQTDPRRIG